LGHGEPGQGEDPINSLVPNKITGFVVGEATYAITAVASGYTHSLALDVHGRVWSWGRHTRGALGHGVISQTLDVPTRITGLYNVVEISAGRYHSIAITSDGRLHTWGRGGAGRLGDGRSTGDESRPMQLSTCFNNSPLPRFKQVAASDSHTLALAVDGSVWSWGSGSNGRLGHGDNNEVRRPRVIGVIEFAVLNGLPATAIGVGSDHSFAILNGRIWAWGHGGSGRLGNNSTSNTNSPVTLTMEGIPTNFIAVSGGSEHSIALTEDGYVYTWGRNNRGVLGRADASENALLPQRVPGLSNVVSIDTGLYHNIALVEITNNADVVIARHVYTWGYRERGRLGHGAQGNNQTTPRRVLGTN